MHSPLSIFGPTAGDDDYDGDDDNDDDDDDDGDDEEVILLLAVISKPAIVIKECTQALPTPSICMPPKVYRAVIPAFVSGPLPTTYGAGIPASVGLLTVVALIRPASSLLVAS